jgi:hypothetical protein
LDIDSPRFFQSHRTFDCICSATPRNRGVAPHKPRLPISSQRDVPRVARSPPRPHLPIEARTAVADGLHMPDTQLAFAHRPTVDRAPRVGLGRELRLCGIPDVLATIRELLLEGASRIELDAGELHLMTEGARQVLIAATQHLAIRDVDLVLVGCDPFD